MKSALIRISHDGGTEKESRERLEEVERHKKIGAKLFLKLNERQLKGVS